MSPNRCYLSPRFIQAWVRGVKNQWPYTLHDPRITPWRWKFVVRVSAVSGVSSGDFRVSRLLAFSLPSRPADLSSVLAQE
jgi:hypothetical protein